MRRSISGKKVQTLRDRSSLFTKEIDANLIREWKRKPLLVGKVLFAKNMEQFPEINTTKVIWI